VRYLAIALLASILCPSSAAFAGGDVCLLDDANDMIFVLTNPRIPKRSGTALPVSGLGLTPGGFTWPLSGTLIRDFDGDLLLGLTRHFDRCLLGFTLDAALNGTVNYDCNLDNSNDMTSAVAAFPCDQL
jgi:hypothetical protein